MTRFLWIDRYDTRIRSTRQPQRTRTLDGVRPMAREFVESWTSGGCGRDPGLVRLLSLFAAVVARQENRQYSPSTYAA